MLWPLINVLLSFALGISFGFISAKLNRFWLGYALLAGYLLIRAIWRFINGDNTNGLIYTIFAIINIIIALIFWWIGRKNNRKKKNLFELLGYKARAARAKLLAHRPQGGRNPGFSPA